MSYEVETYLSALYAIEIPPFITHVEPLLVGIACLKDRRNDILKILEATYLVLLW